MKINKMDLLFGTLVVIIVVCMVGYTVCLSLENTRLKSQIAGLHNVPVKVLVIDNTVQVNMMQDYINQLEKIAPSPNGIIPKLQDGYINLTRLQDYEIRKLTNTGSMLPTLNENTQVLIAKVPVDIGDIACFKNGEIWWCHRIIGEDGDNWIFQGDAIKQQKEFVLKSSEIWRVMAILY